MSVSAAFRRWRLGVAAVCLAGAAVAWLLWTTPQAFPFGDVAVIEIATLTARRDGMTLGPYSQYGWRHPGPVMFYLLTPFHAMAGSKSIGIALGALVVNLTALGATAWLTARRGDRLTAATVTAVLATYLLAAGTLSSSGWNAHLIVLPLAALTVLAAVASLGDGVALVATAVVASGLMQTSVSVVPYAALATLAAALLGGWRVVRLDDQELAVRFRRSVVVALLASVVLWLPPALEQLTERPGNLQQLWHFFVAQPSTGQPWDTAWQAWGEMTTALLRWRVQTPSGQAFGAQGAWPVVLVAAGQWLALASIAVWAARSGRDLLSRVALFTALGSAVALWSITRIAGTMGDYQIFWMSAVGALTLAVLLRAALEAMPQRWGMDQRLVMRALAVLAVLEMASDAGRGLLAARAYARNQQQPEAPRRVVALATAEHLTNAGVRRPVFRMNGVSWLQAAGVVLHVYREHADLAVEASWVPVFGRALAPDGSEDVVLEIGGGCAEGHRVVARADGLCVFETSRD